ncbi:MAG: GT4 family glycosyltransferase PelF [bacterium]
MKNILHCIDTGGPGGAEGVLINIARLIDTERYNSSICLLKRGWTFNEAKRIGIEPFVLTKKHRYDPFLLWHLIRLITEKKIDLIHTHCFGMNLYGALAAKMTGVPVIPTVHGFLYDFEKNRRLIAYKLISRFSKKIVAVSHELKSHLIEKARINPDKVMVIHNGIDLDGYKPIADSNLKKRELDIEPSAPIVGIVGNLRPVKDHETFLQAASQIIKVMPSTKFLVIGDGPLKENLKEQSRKMKLDENVLFLGHRTDVLELLAIMDIFVLSSISEGLSLSILEAMAMSKPVVTTDVGGNPEIIVDGKTGFLVPPKDPSNLASKIMLLKDKGLAERMGGEGRRRVEEHFSLEKMIKNYEQLYEECLE